MIDSPTPSADAPSRILLFSQRHIYPGALWRCPFYEFENILCQIDSVDVLAPHPLKWFSSGTRIANRLASHSSLALNPGISRMPVTQSYDMLFMIASFTKDLLNFRIDKRWKERCKVSVCLVDELWLNQLSAQKCYLDLLAEFDYVMLYYSQSVDTVRTLTGSQCFFLPPGVDALQFCPYPELPKRVVDVYSYGRRSEITHEALLAYANSNHLFYVYDTLFGAKTQSAKDHRYLLANTAKRSRYLTVNPGLIDRPDIRGNQIEIGNRYFEGAAAGAIMIGEIPRNEQFSKVFDWPDAVIHLPFNSDKIGSVLKELDADPHREREIRRNNVTQSLLRHDWVYRWEAVLSATGLRPLKKLLERKARLANVAKAMQEMSGGPEELDRKSGSGSEALLGARHAASR